MQNSNDLLSSFNAGRYSPSPFPFAGDHTLFHEVKTAEFSPLIELDPSNGLSTYLRDTITTTGSGSVTESNGEFAVATGADASSSARLSTKERGRYQPALVGLAGHSVRRPVPATGTHKIWWEYGDGIDAARVGENNNGKYVQLIQNGDLKDKVYQQDWNLDTLDGSGGEKNWSGATLDLSMHNIFRTPYTHYGVGPARIEVFMCDQNGNALLVPIHQFFNTPGQIFWTNPKLPLRQHAENGADGGNIELFVGGRHFGVLGRYNPNRRQTPAFAENRTVTSTQLLPLISFRKKQLRKWQARSVKVSGLNALTPDDLKILIILGGSLTGASWGNPDDVDPQETAMEVDKSATAISGGTAIDGTLANGAQANMRNLAGIRNLGVDIPDDTIVTIAAISLGADAETSATFTIEEEA